MDVSADGDWSLRLMDVALFEQQFFDFVAEGTDCLLLEVFAGLQLTDPPIHFRHILNL